MQRLENSIAQQLAGSTSHSTSSTLPSSPNNPGSSITSNAPASSSSPSSNSSYNPQMFEQQLQNQIFQQQVSFFYLHFLFLCFLFCPDRGGLIGRMFLALDRGRPSVLPTSLLLDAARLVGGGGGSSGATGSGDQFNGLPRPRTFFVPFYFLHCISFRPFLFLFLFLYVLLVVPSPAQEAFTSTSSLLRISPPLRMG
jgi:hypothetical protein